ncbi:DUF2125 domain-containing protein [Falsigemmobacter faecalis]|uniref:DUF2125 domain-containing protein n=1 Tax=Falsigemmobacter faecalis TaxID=2488730 RepID=A0A3P3DLI5_9RHOB|nr:DUF2125 domain-containing protein [Falsigemmobacter faecalis]RRH75109.1 DUF2125 domain-containing protein [Falsigemmobacter faecalis]
MRALIAVIVVAFAAWAGWWFVAAKAGRAGAEAAFTALQAQGWEARHQGIDVQGFPNRVDLTITEPAIAPPASAWGWQAPFVQLLALSYKPWHVIAAFPNEQSLQTPAGPARLRAGKLQASVVVTPDTAVALERGQLAGDMLSLEGPGQWNLDSLSAAIYKNPGEVNAYDLGLTLTGITPDPALTGLLPHGLLPDTLPVLHLDALAGFTAALDRHAAETQPELTHLTLRELRSEWGPVKLHLSGRLVPDAEGLAEGSLQLRLEGAATLIEIMGASGMIAEKDMRNLSFAVKAMSGGQDSVTLPLNFARGRMTLALFPVGPAPRLRY